MKQNERIRDETPQRTKNLKLFRKEKLATYLVNAEKSPNKTPVLLALASVSSSILLTMRMDNQYICWLFTAA